jgi:uncharacterized protein YgiM (DUF1202 family)
MKLKNLAIALIFLLVFVACRQEDEATQVPAGEPTEPVAEETVAPVVVEEVEEIPDEATRVPADEPAEPVEEETVAPVVVEEVQLGTQADADVVSRIGLHPNQVSLNTQGLPFPWQANAVAATPYDASQPPGPIGLPDHIQVNFGTADPSQRLPEEPIMYIIPVDAYKNLWDAAQDESVTQAINGIFQLTTEILFPPPASGLPTLPFEEISGFNDLGVQVDQPIGTDISATKSGYRFVGRFMQDLNPVTNEGMRYIYQGFTNDGKYLVTFFYPATTEFLPDTIEDISQDEMNQAASDPSAYLGQKADQLNKLDTSAWEPDLDTLDDLVSSLVIVDMPPNGIAGQVWQLVARSDGTTEEPLGNTENYTVVFQPNGELNYVADCNSGSGVYDALGGMVGALAIELGPSTLAECGSESYSNEMVETLSTAQDFAVQPGGNVLELIKPAGGGSLLFRNTGPADAVTPGAEQNPVVMPTPEPQVPYAQVIATSGVNIRTGPGQNYAVIGTAAAGEEGPIIGQSQDGLWWAVTVEGAPAGYGWVSASQVQAFNVESVPILVGPTPIPPTPTPKATPGPKPTKTPKAKVRFTADRKKINAGECAILVWQVKNVQAVWVYPKGLSHKDFPVTGEGAQEVCPETTTTYRLRALKTDGSKVQKEVKIKVNAPVAVQLPS